MRFAALRLDAHGFAVLTQGGVGLSVVVEQDCQVEAVVEVVRLQADRLAIFALRICRISLRAQHPRQRAVGVGVGGLEPNGFSAGGDRVVEILLLGVGNAQVVVRLHHVGLQAKRFLVFANGGVVVFLL